MKEIRLDQLASTQKGEIMKRLGENQKIMLEKLTAEGRIENIGRFYRSIASSRTSNKALISFVNYCVEELGYKFIPGKRGGYETAILYK